MAHKVGIHTVNGIDYLYVSRIEVPNEVPGTRRLATAVQWDGGQVFAGALLLVHNTDMSWLLFDRISGAMLAFDAKLPSLIVNGHGDDRVRDYSPRVKDVYSEGSIPEPE